MSIWLWCIVIYKLTLKKLFDMVGNIVNLFIAKMRRLIALLYVCKYGASSSSFVELRIKIDCYTKLQLQAVALYLLYRYEGICLVIQHSSYWY